MSDESVGAIPEEKPTSSLLPIVAVLLLIMLAGAWWLWPNVPSNSVASDSFPSASVVASVQPGVVAGPAQAITFDVIIPSQSISLSGSSVQSARRILQTDAGRQETFAYTNAGSQPLVFTAYYVVPKALAAHATDIKTTNPAQSVLDDPILRIVYRIDPSGRKSELIQPQGSGAQSCIVNVVLAGTPELPQDSLQALANLQGLTCTDSASCGQCNKVSSDLSNLINSNPADLKGALDNYREQLAQTVPTPRVNPAVGLQSDYIGNTIDFQPGSSTPIPDATGAPASNALIFLSELSPVVQTPVSLTSSLDDPIPSMTSPSDLLVTLNQGPLYSRDGKKVEGNSVMSLPPAARKLQGNTWTQSVSTDLTNLRNPDDIFSLDSGSASLSYQFSDEGRDSQKIPHAVPVSFLVNHVDLAAYVYAFPTDLVYTSSASKPLYLVNNLNVPVSISGCGLDVPLAPAMNQRVELPPGGGCDLTMGGQFFKTIHRSSAKAQSGYSLSVPAETAPDSVSSCSDGYCSCEQLRKVFPLYISDFDALVTLKNQFYADYPMTPLPSKAIQKTYLVRNGDAVDCVISQTGSGNAPLKLPLQSVNWLTLTSIVTNGVFGAPTVSVQTVKQDQSMVYGSTAKVDSGRFDALYAESAAGDTSLAEVPSDQLDSQVAAMPDNAFVNHDEVGTG